mmetsp:Transcript_40458/g.89883  ORF Transcript_40458/g.89883 Transcript_40458/m.89883 type:complete len:997 (-) Transcript_40458:1772-4762(-)|eukprot:CAMPEP_0202898216 /NCGR_PEP_ID=MMETSP1392-20130828/6787_1 /ASSEMBLY_ACC=CAM_ASM_000868 /TAXON_ID=225041 /ORGANISM="Chlamydomonas chlamydogama, Strain SAG 11-48b" /LENGTH=996 /DNA_ID=CAMNT_0049584083 /DNA_START=35 /DNA_END=3025 /DNA_ORIENTATION=+
MLRSLKRILSEKRESLRETLSSSKSNEANKGSQRSQASGQLPTLTTSSESHSSSIPRCGASSNSLYEYENQDHCHTDSGRIQAQTNVKVALRIHASNVEPTPAGHGKNMLSLSRRSVPPSKQISNMALVMQARLTAAASARIAAHVHPSKDFTSNSRPCTSPEGLLVVGHKDEEERRVDESGRVSNLVNALDTVPRDTSFCKVMIVQCDSHMARDDTPSTQSSYTGSTGTGSQQAVRYLLDRGTAHGHPPQSPTTSQVTGLTHSVGSSAVPERPWSGFMSNAEAFSGAGGDTPSSTTLRKLAGVARPRSEGHQQPLPAVLPLYASVAGSPNPAGQWHDPSRGADQHTHGSEDSSSACEEAAVVSFAAASEPQQPVEAGSSGQHAWSYSAATVRLAAGLLGAAGAGGDDGMVPPAALQAPRGTVGRSPTFEAWTEPRQVMLVHPAVPPSMVRSRWCMDDYVGMHVVGSGASCQVYKATCKRSRITVALRLYRLDQLGSGVLEQSIMVRAHMRCRLEHRNLLRLYGVFKEHRQLVVVEEYVGGGDLWQLLQGTQGGCLTEQQAVQLVLHPLCRALHYMAICGVIQSSISYRRIMFTHTSPVMLKLVPETAAPGAESDSGMPPPNTWAGMPQQQPLPQRVGILAYRLLRGSSRLPRLPPWQREGHGGGQMLRKVSVSLLHMVPEQAPACDSLPERQLVADMRPDTAEHSEHSAVTLTLLDAAVPSPQQLCEQLAAELGGMPWSEEARSFISQLLVGSPTASRNESEYHSWLQRSAPGLDMQSNLCIFQDDAGSGAEDSDEGLGGHEGSKEGCIEALLPPTAINGNRSMAGRWSMESAASGGGDLLNSVMIQLGQLLQHSWVRIYQRSNSFDRVRVDQLLDSYGGSNAGGWRTEEEPVTLAAAGAAGDLTAGGGDGGPASGSLFGSTAYNVCAQSDVIEHFKLSIQQAAERGLVQGGPLPPRSIPPGILAPPSPAQGTAGLIVLPVGDEEDPSWDYCSYL